MSESLYYFNKTRRERLSVSALGGSDNRHALGRTLASRAFELLVRDQWAGDALFILGDFHPDYEQLINDHQNITAQVIQLIFEIDGFKELGDRAASDSLLYLSICHLIATRRSLELEPHMKQKFGHRFMDRYKTECGTYWLQLKDFDNIK